MILSRPRDWRTPLFLLSAFIILLDRLTKNWVTDHIQLGSTITVIPRVFRISHVLNEGAAFSLFADSFRRSACAGCWSLSPHSQPSQCS